MKVCLDLQTEKNEIDGTCQVRRRAKPFLAKVQLVNRKVKGSISAEKKVVCCSEVPLSKRLFSLPGGLNLYGNTM
jgi:hypothetical protein